MATKHEAYDMRIRVDPIVWPLLHAKLSEAPHSRARAEMLRYIAETYLQGKASSGGVAFTPVLSGDRTVDGAPGPRQGAGDSVSLDVRRAAEIPTKSSDAITRDFNSAADAINKELSSYFED